eukprot:TRINITY_DN18556_c0_g1_i1.p1 TRINITY_DN18556_c0_g1~~TRINITY_DN18556_c0_g1_i1.p1  ORF type:complete len:836 (+),score=262.51 TRINITY_DN18556_c0_g1_i1:66-2573(+)
MARVVGVVALCCAWGWVLGDEEPTIEDLKRDWVEKRAAQGGNMHFSRMATPIRDGHARKKEFRSVVQSDQEAKQAAHMFTPTERERAVQQTLSTCLDTMEKDAGGDGFTYYDTLDCYRVAVEDWGYNSTWWKRIGTLHSLVDAPKASIQAYNESVDQVFRLARYHTNDVNMNAKGGVGFLKLFAHRDLKSATEAAKLMALNATNDRRIEDATHLYDFLIAGKRADDDAKLVWDAAETFAAYGFWSHVAPLIEIIALSDPAFNRGPRVAMALHMIPTAIDGVGRRALSHDRSGAKAKRVAAAAEFVKKHCGRGDAAVVDGAIARRDVAALLTDCMAHQVKKDESLLRDIAKAPKEMKKALLNEARSGFLQETPLHVLAAAGHTSDALLDTLKSLGIDGEATNRFGQTPLHVAMGMGLFDTAKALMRMTGKKNALTYARDATQRTPLDYACGQSSWLDRRALAGMTEEAHGEDPCDLDDEPLVTHYGGAKPRNDFGGWGAALPKDDRTALQERLAGLAAPPVKLPGMKDAMCQIDIRDKSLSGTDLLLQFLLKGKPVLIRGGVPNKVAVKFRKAALMEKMGGMRGRVEAFPEGESYGAASLEGRLAEARGEVKGLPPLADVASLREYDELRFGDDAASRPGTFWERIPEGAEDFKTDGVRALAKPRHPLASLVPLTADHVKAFDFGEFTFNATESFAGHTLFSVGKPGAGAAGAPQQHAYAHIVPYGTRQWLLHPPPHAAATSRHPLDTAAALAGGLKKRRDLQEGRAALQCQQGPGDVLVVPPHWGATGVNLRETVALTQRIAFEALRAAGDEEAREPGVVAEPHPDAVQDSMTEL